MAKLTNTFVTTDAKGNREELSDVVSRITPEDTPLYSLMGTGSIVSTNPQWEIDTLAAPAANIQAEGDEYTFSAITPPVRVGNVAQIMRKEFIISNTQEVVDNAGRIEKIKEQKLKKGIELRKDIEFAIVSNTASLKTDPRRFGSLPSWLTTNVSRGASGANGGYSAGTGLTVAATNGTQRAFTKALLDATMQSAYNNGANVTHAVVSPYVKSVFTTFLSDANVATFRYAASADSNNTIISTADVYLGDFGKVMIVPNRVMAASAAVARNAYLIDPSMLSFDYLRKIAEDKDVAKTGDASKRVLICEGTLRVKNEAGLGVIADLFGVSAAA